jgi:hypothetical protein
MNFRFILISTVELSDLKVSIMDPGFSGVQGLTRCSPSGFPFDHEAPLPYYRRRGFGNKDTNFEKIRFLVE